MNLFYLDKCPKKCAEYHCDKHIVKMTLETAQLLSTAHRILDGEQYIRLSKNNRKLRYWKLKDERENIIYQVFGMNHPAAVWVRLSSGNYSFAFALFKALNEEYEFRYNNTHKSKNLIEVLKNLPKNISNNKMTPPVLVMPEKYYSNDKIEAYRNYYKFDKKKILNYTKREKPYWL